MLLFLYALTVTHASPAPPFSKKDPKACEIQLKDTVRTRLRWTQEDVIRAIQFLSKAGVAVSFTTLRNELDPETLRSLAKVVGSFTTGSNLYKVGYRLFKGWENALQAAGVDPRAVRRKNKWSAQAVIEIVRKLHQMNIPLNQASVVADADRKIARAIAAGFGRYATGRDLFDSGLRYFESWEETIRAAGLDYQAIRVTHEWTNDQILSAIRALSRAGRPLGATRMAKDTSTETSLIIQDEIGFRANGAALFARARERYDTWSEALATAGVDASNLRPRSRRSTARK